jgi:hypothetical protein
MVAAHTYWIGNAPSDIEMPNLYWHFKKKEEANRKQNEMNHSKKGRPICFGANAFLISPQMIVK